MYINFKILSQCQLNEALNIENIQFALKNIATCYW